MKLTKMQQKLFTAILYGVVGTLFCIFRAGMLNWLMTVVGVIFIAYGVLDILDKKIADGVIAIAIGILMILGGWLFLSAILLICGILAAVFGTFKLIKAVKAKAVFKIVVSAVTLLFGVCLIVSRWVDFLFIVIGVALILSGVLSLFGIQGSEASKSPAKKEYKS